MTDTGKRGVLPIMLLAVVLFVIAITWFRAPALHAVEYGTDRPPAEEVRSTESGLLDS